MKSINASVLKFGSLYVITPVKWSYPVTEFGTLGLRVSYHITEF